jgi:general secretion pathway protein A
MYERFFGFRERPFELTPDPRFLFLSAAHREALVTLTYAVTARKSLTVLSGEVGSGKTTMLRAAIAKCGDSVKCVRLNSSLTSAEFTTFLARQFELGDEAGVSKARCHEELQKRLTERASDGCLSALVIDEAHSLPDELFEDIRHLTNLETDLAKLLPVILVGQPELWQRFRTTALRNLRQRVTLRCNLRPLDLQGTASYIAARITVAGGNAAEVFTRRAVTMIHNATQGLPRAISVLCDNALITGLALDQKPVTTAVVEEVCRDFDLVVSPAASVAASEVLEPQMPALVDPAPAGVAIPARVDHAPAEGETEVVAAPASVPSDEDEIESEILGHLRMRRSFFSFRGGGR